MPITDGRGNRCSIGLTHDSLRSVRIAVLGTGRMGAPIAHRLADAGHDVHAWNRTRDRAEGLGAAVAASPSEAVAGAELAITMLADGPVIESVMPELDEATLWVQMSTVGVDETARFAARHARFLDAPVLGSTPHAKDGELLVLASGERAPEELWEPIARHVIWLGDEPGAGTRLKLVANLWIMNLVENVIESFAFAESLGLDPRHFLESISGMPMDTPYAHLKAEKILAADYADPAFTLGLALKDVRLALAAAQKSGVELPLGRATEERFARAAEMGHADDDTAAVYFAARG
jgi:3-hydroxyisobutyrate dehydrogenase